MFTRSRLHVNIFDTDARQFTLPSEFFPRPEPPTESASSLVNSSDLIFNYEVSPFVFWITRRTDPDGQPLFDTRAASLPSVPTSSGTANNITFDGFQTVFEDQYLQVRTTVYSERPHLGFLRICLVDFSASTQCEYLRPRGDRGDQRL